MDKKFKNSENRNAILDILKNTDTHPCADWIYDEDRKVSPSIGVATVYRNLKILLQQHEIFKIDVGDGLDHYDAQIDVPHDHTFCTKCGAIGDIKRADTSLFPDFSNDDFFMDHYSLILFGKCKKCKQEVNS